MKEINERLNNISELVTRIDAKVLEINTKLDELIKALHEYDGDEEYGESSFEAFMDTKGGPCSKHDKASWDEIEANKRMDVIGQNGNEGSHYTDVDENEFSDYGRRIAKEVMSDKDNIRVGKDKSNNSAKPISEFEKHNGVSNPLVAGKEKVLGEWQTKNKNKQYYKNNRSKRNDNKK